MYIVNKALVNLESHLDSRLWNAFIFNGLAATHRNVKCACCITHANNPRVLFMIALTFNHLVFSISSNEAF